MKKIEDCIDHINQNKKIVDKHRIIFRYHFNQLGQKIAFMTSIKSREKDLEVKTNLEMKISVLQDQKDILKTHANVVSIKQCVLLTKQYVQLNPNNFTENDFFMLTALNDHINTYLWFYKSKTRTQRAQQNQKNRQDMNRKPCFKGIPFKKDYRTLFHYVYELERTSYDLCEYSIWDKINGLTINRDRIRFNSLLTKMELFLNQDLSLQVSVWSKLKKIN